MAEIIGICQSTKTLQDRQSPIRLAHATFADLGRDFVRAEGGADFQSHRLSAACTLTGPA